MPSEYRVDDSYLTGESKKWLKRQGDDVWNAIREAVKGIEESPRGSRPTYCHLKGEFKCLWRYRARGLRIVYDIDDDSRIVSLLRVLPRRDAYR